jgi:hypothetical protein
LAETPPAYRIVRFAARAPKYLSEMAKLELREVHKRYPVEDLGEALAEGLITGHPSKPELRFDARDVDDIIDYLKSLEH